MNKYFYLLLFLIHSSISFAFNNFSTLSPKSFIEDELSYSLLRTIISHVGTEKYLLKTDRDGNHLFIGPTGKMIILGKNRKIYKTNNVFSLSFLDDTIKAYEYLDKIADAPSDSFYIDLVDSYGLTEIDENGLIIPTVKNQGISDSAPKHSIKATAQDDGKNSFTININPDLPFVDIGSKNEDLRKRVEWEQYIGQVVNVRYLLDGKTIIVPQKVMSIEYLATEDSILKDAFDTFIKKSKKVLGIDSMFRETGMWIIKGKKGIYVSEIFAGSGYKAIGVDDIIKKGIPLLMQAAEKAFSEEKEEDLNKLFFLHSHPSSGAPLNSTDILAMREIASLFHPDEATVVAIPLVDNGKSIFSHSFCPQRNNESIDYRINDNPTETSV